jgi:hypothetical protein
MPRYHFEDEARVFDAVLARVPREGLDEKRLWRY